MPHRNQTTNHKVSAHKELAKGTYTVTASSEAQTINFPPKKPNI